jgi:hypothetical protein
MNETRGTKVKFLFSLPRRCVNLNAYRQIRVDTQLNIYEAYYENCSYAYINEFFVKTKYVSELTEQLKKLNPCELEFIKNVRCSLHKILTIILQASHLRNCILYVILVFKCLFIFFFWFPALNIYHSKKSVGPLSYRYNQIQITVKILNMAYIKNDMVFFDYRWDEKEKINEVNSIGVNETGRT